MINRVSGNLELECDGCGKLFESYLSDGDDFEGLIDEANDAMWGRRYIDGHWENYCPDCG
jgi:hypothetical protein